MITHVGQDRVARASATPQSQGAGPQLPPKFWDLLYVHTQHEKQEPKFAR